MEYPLPQFLEIKPKVAGPLNFRQLMYIVVGALVAAIFFFIMPLVQFMIISVPIMIVALFLAFGKIKGFPVPTIIMRSFFFLFVAKKYIWHKKETGPLTFAQTKKKKKEEIEPALTPKMTEKSRLKEITKLIEIHPK
jgi:hypothetical protein